MELEDSDTVLFFGTGLQPQYPNSAGDKAMIFVFCTSRYAWTRMDKDWEARRRLMKGKELGM